MASVSGFSWSWLIWIIIIGLFFWLFSCFGWFFI